MKKMFAFAVLALSLTACDPLATCEDSEFPELCGSDVCDTLRECCEANADNPATNESCTQTSDGLTNVPELLRQAARDETCKQVLDQAGDMCE